MVIQCDATSICMPCWVSRYPSTPPCTMPFDTTADGAISSPKIQGRSGALDVTASPGWSCSDSEIPRKLRPWNSGP